MYIRKLSQSLLLALTLSFAAWSPAIAAKDPDPLAVRPMDRISERIDDSSRVVLARHRHPLAKPENIVGQVSPNQRMERMVLALEPDAVQKAALAELIRAQHDPQSPYFHQWLSPEEFGERFGVSSADLEAVVNWLEGHGMKVEEIPLSRRAIVFSGTVENVESTFHTVMRRYSVRGMTHLANATDPEIPRALSSVVRGVVSLHDFHSVPSQVSVPAYNLSNGVHLLMPLDWDTIYDVSPLFSQGLDGTGQSIAVIGRTDIDLNDVRTFRSNAALPANDPQVIVVGPDPGMPNCVDEAESALDTEWAGAIAKNATVKFVTAQSTTSTDGIILASQYAVSNNLAPIITVSYLHCENTLSASGNSFWDGLWAQAESQGQSVFVASGDSGAAGCDDATAKTATQSKGVNGICSSTHATCVGGTQFNDTLNPGAYWSSNNGTGQSSVLGYIPELAWNESGWSNTLYSTGGGVSTVYAKPSWQSAPGVPADSKRDVPDVAFTSAVNDAYVIQIQGKPFYIAGTSAATPSFASVMALVLQNAGSRQGNANPALYRLATLQLSGQGPAMFHDVTKGNNSVPGMTGYTAGAGYDMATGLGSVDAFLLVNNWSAATGANYSLSSPASSVSLTAGNSATATISLNAQGGFSAPVTLSATGAPAGVTITFSSPTVTSSQPVTATFTAASSTSAGTNTVTIAGSGGGLSRNLALPLTVVSPTFALNSGSTSVSASASTPAALSISTAGQNGFKSAISLSATGLPSGVTASFSPTSIASPGTGSSTLTLSVASGTASSVNAITVSAAGGGVTKTQVITLSITGATFALTASASSVSASSIAQGTVTITTSGQNGFKSAIALSAAGLPSGVTAKFTPASIASPGTGSSSLSLTVSGGAAVGASTITVSATGGGVTKTQSITVNVTQPGFTLTKNSSSVSLAPGGSVTVTLTISPVSGFKSAVALSATGLPSGVTAKFSPASIASGSGSSTLTLSAAASAVSGNSTLSVTGTSGTIKQTQSISVTVLKPGFTLTPAGTSVTVAPGGSISLKITTAAQNGFKSAIALSITGLPQSVTAKFSPTSIASPGNGSSTITFAATSKTALGASTVTVTGTGGGVTVSQKITLTVATSNASTSKH